MWATIRAEAQIDADAEPLLSSFLYASVLSHSSFDRALAFVLANRLACPQLLAVQLVELCNDVLESEEQARWKLLLVACVIRHF
jgi:serine O-acetyltransferase